MITGPRNALEVSLRFGLKKNLNSLQNQGGEMPCTLIMLANVANISPKNYLDEMSYSGSAPVSASLETFHH